MKGKKIVSTLLALLLLASLPVSALAAEWDISKGDITVNAGSGGQTVTQGGGAAVEDSAPVITGSSQENNLTINAESGQTASVTLSGANIDVSGAGKAAVSMTGAGNVSIELNGENTLKSGEDHAGLEKNNGGSLTIADEDKNGKLTAEGGDLGAGIGGGYEGNGNNIAISGGEITAIGGDEGAGIGGGYEGNGNNIAISGGKIKATGGDNGGAGSGAGIGGGREGNGNNITISGGEIKATGGSGGAGIGGGDAREGYYGCDGSDITFSTSRGNGNNIAISGGEITAIGGDEGAGIGGGYEGNGNNIAISGGEIKATGGDGGAGIGGGEPGNSYNGNGSDITISGGEVKAIGGVNGAGIGGGTLGNGNNIAISGGEIKATGGDGGAGIGSGGGGNGNNITISGGEVKAIGGVNGAGIGGGLLGEGKDITVSGAAKLKVQGGVEDDSNGAGAGIGDGGSNAEDGSYLGGSPVPGAEVEPDTSGLLTTGWIEYYAPGADMETDDPIRITRGTLPPPEKPIEPSAERGMDAPLYRMTDKYDRDIAYTAEQTGGVLTVTVDEDFAVLTGSLSGMTALRAQGVEKLVFVTKGATSAFMLSDLLEKGESGESYWLTHDGKAVTFTLGEGMADVSAILTKP